MEIGEPQRQIEIIPLKEPLPIRVPDHIPAEWEMPIEAPHEEEVPVAP